MPDIRERSERRPYPLSSRPPTVHSSSQAYLSEIRSLRGPPRSARTLASGTAQLWTTLLATPLKRDGTVLEPAQSRNLADAHRRLFVHRKSRRWLEKEHLSMHTAAHFHLGLSSAAATGHVDALVFPLMDAAGIPRKRRIYLDMPGITRQDLPWRDTWTLGVDSTYWATPAKTQRTVIVCHQIQLGWRLWQLLGIEHTDSDLCLIAATPGGLPAEWRSPDFWSAWDTLYFACDSESQLGLISEAREGFRSRIVRTLLPPGTQSWRSFFLGGGTADDVHSALIQATHVFLPARTTTTPASFLDVNMAFTGGHLHYPFYQTTFSMTDAPGPARPVPSTQVGVLRSDGVILSVLPVPTPHLPGAPAAYLDDGTLLERFPAPMASRLTFTPATIAAFQAGRLSGRTAMSRSAADVLTGVRTFLGLAAPTLAEDQMALLAYVVFLSYVQAVFPVVPLIWMLSTEDTSVLAQALSHVGCNATLFRRHVDAEVLAATLDSLGGLVVLHDFPSASDAPEDDRVLSVLSSSCHQVSARHAVAGAPGHPPVFLKTSGVSVLFGWDALPSHLQHRSLFLAARLPQIRGATLEAPDPAALRNDLHLWAMEHAADLHALSVKVQSIHPGLQFNPRTQALVVVARTVGEPEAEQLLIRYLKRTCEAIADPPVQVKKIKS